MFAVKPQVQVENHFVGAPIGTDIRLYCRIEASPKPTFQWFNNRRNYKTFIFIFFPLANHVNLD